MAATFEVDKKGLAQLVRRRGGIVHAIEELVSNAQDENVTRIGIRFERVERLNGVGVADREAARARLRLPPP